MTSNVDVHNWIKFAIEKKVRTLELNVRRFRPTRWHFGQYTFPPYFDSYSNFSSLTELSLANVAVTGDVLEHLLSYCALLEVLSVAESECLRSLKVSGSLPELKYLTLGYLEYLEIKAPNLVYFKFCGLAKAVYLGKVRLAEVSFSGFFCIYIMKNLRWLSSFLVRLHTLKLSLVSPVGVP